jgi:hypothetical protein
MDFTMEIIPLVSINQIARGELYAEIRTSETKLYNLSKEGIISIKNNSRGIPCVPLIQLVEFLQIEKEISDNFYIFHKAVKKLTKHRKAIKYTNCYRENMLKFAYETKIRTLYFRGHYYFNKKDLNSFLQEHIPYFEAGKALLLPNANLYYIIKSNNIPTYVLSHKHKFYPRKLLEPLIQKANIKIKLTDSPIATDTSGIVFNTDDFYPTPYAQKLLNLYERNWKNVRDTEDIKETRFAGRSFYPKQAINILYQKQIQEKTKYYCLDEIEKLLNLNRETIGIMIRKYQKDVPPLLRGVFPKQTAYIFLKTDINPIIEHQIQLQIYSTLTDPIEMFEFKLSTNKVSINKESETIKLWFTYTRTKLNAAKDFSYKYISDKVNDFFHCTNYIFRLVCQKEIYNQTANEINLVLFNSSISKKRQQYLYNFLKEIHHYYLNIHNKKIFKFDRIINPYKSGVTKREKSIYPFEEYKRLFDYCNNIYLHKIKAIQAVKLANSNNDSDHYDSAWLYVLVHLNNAWRHGDIIRFPRIDFKETPDEKLKYMESHDVCLNEAQSIIRQIIRKDLKTSKTNATNNFYCSEDLCISLATAAIICEIRTRVINPSNKYIIDFNVKNNSFSQKAQKSFFQGLNDNFKFESLKLNRSLLSYTYSLLVHKGKHSSALEVAKRLRAHFDYETTNIYITIPENELGYLTNQLFKRQHFGYIPNLLVEVLYGECQNREERTLKIIKIRDILGDIYGIEHLSNFLNTIQSERDTVAEKILKMGFDEAAELLFKIDSNLLPAKEENYQCLHENCIKPFIKCIDCTYAIPNFYTLSSLAKDLQERVEEFNKFYYQETFEAEKIKLANRLSLSLNRWREAIDKFGKEDVYKFADKTFLEKQMNLISSNVIIDISMSGGKP